MSDSNRGYDRSRPYSPLSGTAEPFRSLTIPNAATGTRSALPSEPSLWPPMPHRPRQQSTRIQNLTSLLGEALRRYNATLARVEEERQKYRRLQLDFDRRREVLGARVETCRAQLEVGNPAYMSVEYIRGHYEKYQWRYDQCVEGHIQDRAALNFAEEEHRQTVREVASAQRRLQEEIFEEREPAMRRAEFSRRMLQDYGVESEEPQLILDNVEEASEDEGFSVSSLRELDYDNDEGM